MPLLTPPPSKPQRRVRATFTSLLDGFIAWLVDTFYNELLALVASLNSLAAGGAYAIPYAFNTGVAGADPTNGKLSVNNALVGSATAIYVSWYNSAGGLVNAYLNSINTSTSAVKGDIRLVSMTDPSRYVIFGFNGITADSGTYKTLSVFFRSSTMSGTFNASEPVMLQFSRTGDKGDTGPVYTPGVLHLREEKASGTAGTAPTNLGTGLWRRPINTVKTNTMSGASLASDQFVLPAGTHEIDGGGFSMVSTGSAGATYYHKMALYNVTDGVYALIGGNAMSSAPTGSTAYQSTDAPLRGSITIAAAKTFELRHLTPSATLQAPSAASTGQVEVYTDIFIKKVA
jgi:hypothetical protein